MKIYYSCFDKNLDDKKYSKEFLAHVFKLNKLDINSINILRTDKGRPYSNDICFDFNLSHTKGMVALAMCSKSAKVGIDCQLIVPVKQRVIERVCTLEEQIQIETSLNKDEEFIRLWTFKEAYCKMIGSGFAYGFKNATIENAFCIYNEIKIHQEKIESYILTSVINNSLLDSKIEVIRI